ncbi:pentatricopeptide repeat-containing protein [Tripterygium wilfordii]|uniref:Pentatricopeptide repeat-containing protein n=2 Tax=Tripterygium wilfordii TaxID=458696 RepID=A0A7J7DFD8_TRIWF|nr:pentatricopeptide repeat-containing protein [Tripterygium wilfordii]
MFRQGVRPDDYTFPCVLNVCAHNMEVQKGMEIHGVLFKTGIDFNVFVGNALMLFYGNCGNLRDARRVFDEMVERDVVSWNTLIGVSSINGFHTAGLELFSAMNLMAGFKPNVVTVVTVLPACAEIGDEVMAMQVHCYVVKVGLNCHVTIGNALIDVYGKCRNMEATKQAFDEMVCRSEVSWNSIISSLSFMWSNEDALNMFRHMIDSGMKPGCVAISSMLPVVVELKFFKLGKEIHAFCLRMHIQTDVFVANSLIDMYAKSGSSIQASNVFHHMGERNVVSWNTMVANFAQNRLEFAAMELTRQMQAHGEIPNAVTFANVLPACARIGYLCPGKQIHAKTICMGFSSDLFVSNALTDMYVKCGSLDLARAVFDISLRDEVSYNILILGYSQTSVAAESLSLFSEMARNGMKHDIVSLMGVISACASLTATKQGTMIHGLLVRKHFHSHLFVANSLLDFYTKCGRIDLAHRIFDRIPKKDAASWNTMILGYGLLGQLDIAINLFEAMKVDGVHYDSVSYIAILSACSHGGLLEKGRKYFADMQAQNIEPMHMHYTCMVDLLARAGLLEEATELVKSLPIIPDANIWGALLGACRIYGNIELARWASDHLFKLKPQHSGYYLLLANMYAEAGEWDESNKIRRLMKTRSAKKNPGCSWLRIDNEVHAFVSGERIKKLDPGLWIAESN